jgi:hypothetical protein
MALIGLTESLVMEPTYLSVAQLFQRYICEVPRYQRGYTWDDPQVDDFTRDLLKCVEARGRGDKRPYFFRRFGVLTEWFRDQPRTIETFLPFYKRHLDNAIRPAQA